MRIAIIGAGNVGGGLAAAATKAGHDVKVVAAHPEHAEKVAAETGATAATAADAAGDADVVVLAVPFGAAAGVLSELGATVAGKVVVDATNPLDDTFSDLTTVGTSATELLAAQFPQVKLVKALNTVLAGRLTSAAGLDAFYAGDDATAKAAAVELLQSLGFSPVDAGGLRMARTLEEMALLNITLNVRNNWPWQSAWGLSHQGA
ncbi:NADPH-dependent F420 reductase [Amycolatopsis sp. FDAARGOS 1241]|uniref:NADPH-dependent F420 reductase n=1 Tax=Amycolatopsis sp. FDAARGOS 1241 TaxID=2778070 RepID=UPI001951A897|nr:NAD(P)-binding domain-containing protein [Amycolatopsis sp. FDAARGOS 1241]QRP44777.1 NAD(P)-binding domain-containing protein [Amycolatopsis sp. FDAARGOS 1241]